MQAVWKTEKESNFLTLSLSLSLVLSPIYVSSLREPTVSRALRNETLRPDRCLCDAPRYRKKHQCEQWLNNIRNSPCGIRY